MTVVIEPIRVSSELSEYADSFRAGNKNLDSVLQNVDPLVQSAYTAMSNYLADAAAQRGVIAAQKEAILAERRRQAELNIENK